MPLQPKAPEKVHCNKCLQETNHRVVATDHAPWMEDLGDGIFIDGYVTHFMLKCKGCESVTLRREEYFSEWEGSKIEHYPPSVSRPEPNWVPDLPESLQELLREIYAALHADSRCLAVMGARAAVDLVLCHKAGDVGTFKDKMQALVSGGHVGATGAGVLEAALEAGHAAAHRGHRASRQGVADVMDIVEQLLHSVYISPLAAARLRQSTPPRTGGSARAAAQSQAKP